MLPDFTTSTATGTAKLTKTKREYSFFFLKSFGSFSEPVKTYNTQEINTSSKIYETAGNVI